MHRFGLLIVAALFLASCGGSPAAPATTTSPSAQASVQPSAEPSSAASAEPSSEPSAEPSPSASAEASTEAEASPDTGAAGGIDSDVATYATEIQEPLTAIGEGLTGFATLFSDAKLDDEAWKAEVVAEMDKIRKGHEDLTNIDPPAAAEPAHEQLITATSDCNQATDKITSGLENNNVTEIGEASTLILSCGEKLQTAQEMLVKLAPQ